MSLIYSFEAKDSVTSTVEKAMDDFEGDSTKESSPWDELYAKAYERAELFLEENSLDICIPEPVRKPLSLLKLTRSSLGGESNGNVSTTQINLKLTSSLSLKAEGQNLTNVNQSNLIQRRNLLKLGLSKVSTTCV